MNACCVFIHHTNEHYTFRINAEQKDVRSPISLPPNWNMDHSRKKINKIELNKTEQKKMESRKGIKRAGFNTSHIDAPWYTITEIVHI